MDKKKILIVVGVILLLILIVVGIFSVRSAINTKNEEIEYLEMSVEDLTWQVDAFGDVVDVYTVVASKKSGQIFDNSDVALMSLPSTQISDQFITNLADIQNCIYKIDIEPGMPLVSDIFFREVLTPTDRYHDVVADLFPVGARQGDYYDLRIVTPQGLDYIVLSKKRAIDFYETAVRLVLSEEELHQYQSSLVDCFLNPGTYLYVTTYVEPSMQKQASIYYPVSDVVRAVMEIDPNIVQLAEAELIAKSRKAYEGGLVYDDDLAAAVLAGRSAQISKIVSAAQSKIAADEEALKNGEPSNGSEQNTGMVSPETGNLITSSTSSTSGDFTSNDVGSAGKTEQSMQFDGSMPIIPEGLADEIASTPEVIS